MRQPLVNVVKIVNEFKISPSNTLSPSRVQEYLKFSMCEQKNTIFTELTS